MSYRRSAHTATRAPPGAPTPREPTDATAVVSRRLQRAQHHFALRTHSSVINLHNVIQRLPQYSPLLAASSSSEAARRIASGVCGLSFSIEFTSAAMSCVRSRATGGDVIGAVAAALPAATTAALGVAPRTLAAAASLAAPTSARITRLVTRGSRRQSGQSHTRPRVRSVACFRAICRCHRPRVARAAARVHSWPHPDRPCAPPAP